MNQQEMQALIDQLSRGKEYALSRIKEYKENEVKLRGTINDLVERNKDLGRLLEQKERDDKTICELKVRIENLTNDNNYLVRVIRQSEERREKEVNHIKQKLKELEKCKEN